MAANPIEATEGAVIGTDEEEPREPVAPVLDAAALQFVYDGRQRLTAAAVAIRQLREWADVFEQRGGLAVYGNEALEIVYFSNDLQMMMDDKEASKRAAVSRLRTDI